MGGPVFSRGGVIMKCLAFPSLVVVALSVGCVINSGPPPATSANTTGAPTHPPTPTGPHAPPTPCPSASAAPAPTPAPPPPSSSSSGRGESKAPPPPTAPPQNVTFNAVDGRPKGLHSGAPEAYWVWHDGK